MLCSVSRGVTRALNEGGGGGRGGRYIHLLYEYRKRRNSHLSQHHLRVLEAETLPV